MLQADSVVPRRFFHALAVEAPGVRAGLQEALSALAIAYKGVSGGPPALCVMTGPSQAIQEQCGTMLCMRSWTHTVLLLVFVPCEGLAGMHVKLEYPCCQCARRNVSLYQGAQHSGLGFRHRAWCAVVTQIVLLLVCRAGSAGHQGSAAGRHRQPLGRGQALLH